MTQSWPAGVTPCKNHVLSLAISCSLTSHESNKRNENKTKAMFKQALRSEHDASLKLVDNNNGLLAAAPLVCMAQGFSLDSGLESRVSSYKQALSLPFA